MAQTCECYYRSGRVSGITQLDRMWNEIIRRPSHGWRTRARGEKRCGVAYVWRRAIWIEVPGKRRTECRKRGRWESWSNGNGGRGECHEDELPLFKTVHCKLNRNNGRKWRSWGVGISEAISRKITSKWCGINYPNVVTSPEQLELKPSTFDWQICDIYCSGRRQLVHGL